MKRKKIDAAKNLKNHIKYSKSNFEKKWGVFEIFGNLEFFGSLPQKGHKYHHNGRDAGLIEPLDTRFFKNARHAIRLGMYFWFCFRILLLSVGFFNWLICLVALFFNLSELI